MRKFLSIFILVWVLLSTSLLYAEEKTQPAPAHAAVEQGAAAQASSATTAPKIDTGDTAWMIVATALVMLMTLPGLALFYGGLAKRKDMLNTMAMSFIAFCIVSVLWVLYGYTFAFNGDIGGVIGNGAKLFLSGVGVNSITDAAKTIPEYIFIVYQLTFAAITVALASGAYIERMKFSAWILFSILWLTFAYLPVAHWVWGGGFLAKLGALDFAGGTVVHINAGIAALVGALIMGKRRQTSLVPNNMTAVVTGAGLLWFGWFGFNAGSALAANGLAGAAFINTNTATAIAAMAWMAAEWTHSKKPTVLGLASGAVAGLVAITPAAGYVNVSGALFIGAAAGIVAFFSVAAMKPKFGYDDTLDAFGIHGVAGTLGAILTGVFADPSINESGRGLLYGNPGQLLTQLIAIGVTLLYTGTVTFVIFMIVKAVSGLRVDEEAELAGLDESVHGEMAYNLQLFPGSSVIHGHAESSGIPIVAHEQSAYSQE
jgi:Amt family ammonium transporter